MNIAEDISGHIGQVRSPNKPTMLLSRKEDPMFILKNKVAVITGAAAGLGKATAIRFAEAGAKVVVADIGDGSEVAKEAGGLFVETDVSKEDQVEQLMEKTVSEFGKLDIVINNAGIGCEVGEIKDISEKDLDDGLNVNLKGVIWGIKHAVPKISDGGSIVNVSSFAGYAGALTYGTYVATKSAVIGITKTAALELAPRGIRVNCICPGTMDTAMTHEDESSQIEYAVSRVIHPLGRLGTADDAAALFHFLASDDSGFITGLAIPLDGGMSAGFSLGVVGSLYNMTTG